MHRCTEADRLGATRGRLGVRKLMLLVGTTVALVMLAASSALAASPGALDTSFGSGGIASGPAGARFFGSTVQSDGKLIAVGESGAPNAADVVVKRFTASGAPDSSFGSGGVVAGPTIDSGGIVGSVGRAVAVQSDGKLVVVGKATSPDGSGQLGILVERFNANGGLDSSFGTGGVVHLLTSTFGDGYAVAIQPNGQILAAGSVQATDGTSRALVVRLNANGTPDTSFGSGGIDTVNLGADSIALGIALQPDGKIVLAGSQSPQLQAVNAVVARLTSTGSLDSSFAGTGAVAKQLALSGAASSSFNAVAVQSNGAIVAAGNATSGTSAANAVFERFTSSGSLDGGFGSGGTVYLPSASAYAASGTSVPGANAVQQVVNGDIVAAGYSQTGLETTTTLWALTPTGAPVASFGTGGVVHTSPGPGQSSEAASLSIAPDGSLDIAGDTSSPIVRNSYAGTAARYGGFGAPPAAALAVTLKNLNGTYTIKSVVKSGIKFGATCNEACALKVSLVASKSTAKTLGLLTTTKVCKKVHGKKKCTTTHKYAKTTVLTGSSKLSKAGTHNFTLKFKNNIAKALGKIKKKHSVKLSLTVSGSTAKAKKSVTKTLTFKP
jgi:uncharacterized delta-60 repeat protein